MLFFLDFLGPDIGLTIKRNRKFRSNFGGVASLLLILITGATFFGFGRDIFERRKPRVTFNKIIHDETPNIVMTENNFLFAIYDQQTDEPIPDFERRFHNYYDYLGKIGDGTDNRKEKIPMVKQWK